MLPDYQIRQWNEDTFDLTCNLYVQQSYESKKWAFVTDYVRLKALYDFGGIYMDTDVEVLKPLDEFMSLPAFSGFEGEGRISTGTIGAMKGNKWIEELLKDYEERLFIKDDGSYDLTPNVETITRTTQVMYQIDLDNQQQSLADVSLYPVDWFCAKSYETGRITKTENTHTIHHFAGSWVSSSQKLKNRLNNIIGKNGMKELSNIKQFILRGKKL